MSFNAAAFYTDISNLQVPLDAGSCSSRIVFNVPKAHTMGVEFEGNPRTFISGLPFGGATGNEATIIDLKLPAYELINLSAGVEWQNGLEVIVYVHNLLDETPLLSFDRERGGRARLGFNVGTPRTFGVTVRKGF